MKKKLFTLILVPLMLLSMLGMSAPMGGPSEAAAQLETAELPQAAYSALEAPVADAAAAADESTVTDIAPDGGEALLGAISPQEGVTPATYTVETVVLDDGHGSLSVDKTSAAEGETVTITATPDAGYELSRLTVWDADKNDVAITGNTFAMPASNAMVRARFVWSERQLHVSATEGGAYSFSGSADQYTASNGSVARIYDTGSEAVLTVTPDSGYTFKGWYEGVLNSYGMVTGNTGTLLSSSASYSVTLNEDAAMQAVFEETAPTTYYELWVGGEQVTSANAADILGGGTVSFDAGTNTLTLDNAQLSTTYEYRPYYEAVIYTALPSLTINLVGTNKLSPSGAYADGIDAAGGCDVTITGGGTLNIENGYYGFYIGSWDVQGGNLTINGATLNVSGTSATGIWVNHNTIIINSSVTVTKTNNSYAGLISNTGGTVTVTSSDVQIHTPMTAVGFGNGDASNHSLVLNSGTLTLISDLKLGIHVEPVGDSTGPINGMITINGGVLSITSAEGASDIPAENITIAEGLGYTTGSSLALNGDKNVKIEPIVTTYTVTAEATPAEGGTASGGGAFDAGNTVTVTATPNTGYRFVNWTADGTEVSTDASYTFTATANVALVANFVQTHSVTVTATPTEGGTVSGGGTFDNGVSVTVTATPAAGYRFVKWTEGGADVSTEASYTFTATADVALTANFVQTHSVTVTATPTAGGTVTGGGTFDTGSSVTLTATPNTGYQFKEWQVVSGGVTITDNKFTIGTENVEIKAIFSVSSEVSTETVVDKNTTVYAGEILVDGASQLKYLYSNDITVTATVFDNLKEALAGTAFQAMVPAIVNETTVVNGFFRYAGNAQQGTKHHADTDYYGGVSEDWSSVTAVAERCFTGTVGTETNDNDTSFDSVLSTSISSTWAMRDGSLVRLDTVTFHVENITVVKTTVNVTTPTTTYTVTVTDGGRVLADRSVAEGGKIARPADPVKEGFVFDGWYSDAAFTTAFDFDMPITADTTLYAKWTAAGYVLTSVTGATADASHSWTKGSTGDVVITVKLNDGVDHSYAHFTGVQLDGAALVSGTDYTAREGSTVVTLLASLLQNRSVGAHTVKILFDNGEVSTTVTVKAADAPTATPAPTASSTASHTSPRTGDASAPGLWIAVMAVSGLGLTALAAAGKKRRSQR